MAPHGLWNTLECSVPKRKHVLKVIVFVTDTFTFGYAALTLRFGYEHGSISIKVLDHVNLFSAKRRGQTEQNKRNCPNRRDHDVEYEKRVETSWFGLEEHQALAVDRGQSRG